MNTPLEIDLVYTWVDGNDPEWQKKKAAATGDTINARPDGDCKGRYADNDELKFSLRSVDLYAPWIRRIFIVTDNQVPAWLDTSNPRIRIVDHRDIIPAQYLPCFNSTLIEHFICRIPGLAEHFILANDDMMLNKPVTPADFFDTDGNPVMRLVRRPANRLLTWMQLNLLRKKTGTYKTIMRNSARLVNRRFGKYFEAKPHHNMDGYRKSHLIHVEELFADEFRPTLNRPLRSDDEYQRIIYYYTALAEGGKGRAVYVDDHTSFQMAIQKAYHYTRLEARNPTFFCVNDNPKATDADRKAVRAYLLQRFPAPSQFEK